ncbi:putative glycerol-3-phosphate 1-O-acyltransferase [Rosa chinensis]|uniref:Putative glycerol-3-phosphate 1-O-acyltransferase n=1 Tax=Rosa chinensis TaxID=74649 RepID=A0A2P6RFE8_ROSCH|nr:probable glycerol-3-phosphate acyltransferase 2 [Rosa chinensis]PRQ45156.1 putative glycerol-3-phosphate 1-O-acyltransferase [Rosa chinensis]
MPKPFFFKPFFFLYRIFFRKSKRFQRSASNSHASQSKSHIHAFDNFAHRYPDLKNLSLIIFNMEEALLKSSSLFPYFMLVAFEAGSLLRAFVLFLLYPLMFLVSEEVGLKIMVMVCFFGIKKESFRIGRAVLPKFFLEDVGLESFEVLQRAGKKKVGVSNLPQVLIETFLKDYLEIDVVIGRELKVFGGYFLGLMEEKKNTNLTILEERGGHDKMGSSDIIGITSFNQCLDDPIFSYCKDVYRVRSSDKRSWKNLPKEKYPKKLIFHDGRLALKPTPLETVAIFMWAPVGFVLAVVRILLGISLPYEVSSPLLAFTGLRLTVRTPQTESLVQKDPRLPNDKPKGVLYVCNHRTLLDPLYLCFAMGKNLHAVTYSLSKMSEILAPIKTVRLARNRQQDQDMMKRLLSQGDLVVCPEGTTCREPYLLRFSPLFSEISDEIVPVAVDSHVSMFHGTTAGGLKSLDPVFFLLNPSPIYTVQLLEKVSSEVSSCRDGSTSRFDVANYVQRELGKVLGFECTKLTRREKYLILAGNEGKAGCKTA